MRDKLFIAGRCYPFLILVCALLLNYGCGRKEESKTQDTAASEAAINSYSTENVFEEYLRKVQADPNNVDNLYHLADLYDRNGQYEKAVATFAKVIALKPDMGYAYLKKGNQAAARAEYQALNEFDGTMARELLQRLESGQQEKK